MYANHVATFTIQLRVIQIAVLLQVLHSKIFLRIGCAQSVA